MGDVVPALKTNSEGLGKVLEDLVGRYKGLMEGMEGWKVCFSLISSSYLFFLFYCSVFSFSCGEPPDDGIGW